jgi:hypothetical protein
MQARIERSRRNRMITTPIETILKTVLTEFENNQRRILVEDKVAAPLRGAEQFVDFLLRGLVRKKHEIVSRRRT